MWSVGSLSRASQSDGHTAFGLSATGVGFCDQFLGASSESVILDTMQSEEGGRFFREENRNVIRYQNSPCTDELPPRYMWCTLRQLKELLKFNNHLNVESRSLLALI